MTIKNNLFSLSSTHDDTAIMTDTKGAEPFEDVFEEEMDAPKDPKMISHIRANSTIMHATKVLGKSLLVSGAFWLRLRSNRGALASE